MAKAMPTRAATADRILDAALDAFGTRGYGATSLDDLAGDLGIRKQTILYWYSTKEVLLDAAIDRTAAEVTRRLERAVASAPRRRAGCSAPSPRWSPGGGGSWGTRWTRGACAATPPASSCWPPTRW